MKRVAERFHCHPLTAFSVREEKEGKKEGRNEVSLIIISGHVCLPAFEKTITMNEMSSIISEFISSSVLELKNGDCKRQLFRLRQAEKVFLRLKAVQQATSQKECDKMNESAAQVNIQSKTKQRRLRRLFDGGATHIEGGIGAASFEARTTSFEERGAASFEGGGGDATSFEGLALSCCIAK